MKHLMISVVVAAGLAGTAHAQEVPFTDLNKTTCKEFVALPDLPVGLILHFADGYMSGRAGKAPVYDPAGMDKIGERFGLYCGKNPDATVMSAVEYAWK